MTVIPLQNDLLLTKVKLIVLSRMTAVMILLFGIYFLGFIEPWGIMKVLKKLY